MGRQRGVRLKCPPRVEGLMLPFPLASLRVRLCTNREDHGRLRNQSCMVREKQRFDLPSQRPLLPGELPAELEHTDHSRDPPLEVISQQHLKGYRIVRSWMKKMAEGKKGVQHLRETKEARSAGRSPQTLKGGEKNIGQHQQP